jgi:pimeloyl-ACP methyl ester carboxylesterase
MIDKTASVLGYYRKMPEHKAKLKKPRPYYPGARVLDYFVACFLLLVVTAWPAPAHAAKVMYKFSAWNGPEMRVFVTRPVGLAPDRPVVFVMHGVKRNAIQYRDQWHDLAIEHDFLLVVPEFSERRFPGPEQYDQGNVFDEQGGIRAESDWSYAAIEAIFDDVRSRFHLSTDTYSLYGHSAGAQFVQRFIFHVPAARVKRVVAANAGWYMMPDFDLASPYGLAHSAVDRNRLERGLRLPVTILLGEEETETDDDNLRATPESLAQGPQRLARGQAFFEAARAAADRLGVPFDWSLHTVPGDGHDNRLMAPAAIPFLLSE